MYKQAQNKTITTKYRTLATIGFPSVFLQLSGALKHQVGFSYTLLDALYLSDKPDVY